MALPERAKQQHKLSAEAHKLKNPWKFHTVEQMITGEN